MRSITEFCERHPISLHHTIPIDFKSVLKLPDSHIWCGSSTHVDPASSTSPANSVPVIDMNDPNAMHLMKKASEEWGMFQIINHGIAMELLQQMEDHTRKLFALPAEQKLRALRSPNALIGYGLPRISPFFTKQMWSEGFTIQGSPLEHALLLWPQDSTVNVATFCNVINQYQEVQKELCQKILDTMLISLGLTHDDVKWFGPNTFSKSTQPMLQLNSYPMCPDPGQAMGLAPHTDSSLITLLYQSNTRGLQVFRDHMGWITVEPISGALVVNIGDLLQILSNGLFKSALHRAVVNKAQHRISVATFYGPPKDVEISPPMRLLVQGQLPLYRRVSWKEYLNVKAVCFNRALQIIRCDPLKARN